MCCVFLWHQSCWLLTDYWLAWLLVSVAPAEECPVSAEDDTPAGLGVPERHTQTVGPQGILWYRSTVELWGGLTSGRLNVAHMLEDHGANTYRLIHALIDHLIRAKHEENIIITWLNHVKWWWWWTGSHGISDSLITNHFLINDSVKDGCVLTFAQPWNWWKQWFTQCWLIGWLIDDISTCSLSDAVPPCYLLLILLDGSSYSECFSYVKLGTTICQHYNRFVLFLSLYIFVLVL